MTLLDFLNPGSVVDSGTWGRIQFGLFHFALGFAAVWGVRRLTRRAAPGGVGIYALAVLAPACGLVLANVSYQSSGCLPNPEFCVSFATGFPLRVACGQHDPADVFFFDGCGALSSSMFFFHGLSWLAAAGDYLLGLFGVSVIASCVESFRSRDRTRGLMSSSGTVDPRA